MSRRLSFSPGLDSQDSADVFDGPTPEHELALHVAIREKNLFQVISLLEKEEINVNWSNPQDGNRTALHLAVAASDSTMVALLLGRGAEVHLRDDSGQTPMNIILDKGDNQILKLVGCKAISSLEESKSQLDILSAPVNQKLSAHLLEKVVERRERTLSAPSSPLSRDKRPGDVVGSPVPRNRSASRLPKAIEPSEIPVVEDFSADVAAECIEQKLNAMLENNPKQLSKYQTHFPRISAMSELLKISHFKTVKNIWISVLLIAIANTLLYNYFESGVILDFSLFFWSFGQMDHAVVLWGVMFLYSFSAPFLQKAIVSQHLSVRIAYLCYILLSAALFAYVPQHIRAFNFPPATSFFIMCETMRLWMKMHSYLMVNRSLRRDKAAGSTDPNVQVYPRNVTYSGYFYFLWVPTLVYQISYPRNKTVRWGFVFATFFEAVMTVLYTYAIFARYCMPYFQEMDGDYKSLVLGIFKVMMPGTAVALMAFYGLLHSWFNAWAEVTRFADRQFYTDWWNATGWSQYYRKWNSVVHNFLHRHVFLECKETLHLSTNGAMWATFLLSAIAHEYIIACALGFWKPVLLLMFSVPGVLFVYLTSSFRGWNGWNVFMWCMLIVGHGMLVGLYRRAWHYHVEMGASMPWWDALWIA